MWLHYFFNAVKADIYTRFSVEILSMYGTVRLEITSSNTPDNDRVLVYYPKPDDEYPAIFFLVESSSKLKPMDIITTIINIIIIVVIIITIIYSLSS